MTEMTIPYIILILLCLILFSLMICLYKKNKQIKMQKTEIEGIRRQLDTVETEMSNLKTTQESIWDEVNTIFLYAALSEEEANSSSLRQKQTEILRISEEILQQTGSQQEKGF